MLVKFSVLAAICAAATNAVVITPRQAIPSREQITALAPDLGGQPNTNPNQFGDCDGPRQANGNIPRVPCACPPTRDHYIAALIADIEAGHAVNNTVVKMSFPTGNTPQDKHGRITAAIIALQNLEGPGKGCPGVSTTLGIQSNNIDKCGDFFCGDAPASSSSSSSAAAAVTTSSPPPVVQPAATQAPVNVAAPTTVTVTSIKVVTSIVTVTAGQTPAASPPAAATTTTRAQVQAAITTSSSAAAATSSTAAVGNGQLTRDLVDQLAPQLGSQPNNNPNSAGDCDGPPQLDGSIKRVPCACPPNRPDFIDSLFADIQAGHAVHNPSVKVDFPTGNSKADQHARINAASIALQNLNGPGQGCPFVSTTFGAQSAAIDA